MKRIPLPNESRNSWEVDPSSIEQVIESRLRVQDHIERITREAPEAEPSRFKKGALGLSDAEIDSIRWEAVLGFLESARLPDELRKRRAYCRDIYEKRIERFSKMPDASRDLEISQEAELHAVAFARAREVAITRATGHFADMLTQATISKRGRKDFPLALRAKLWTACLEFAMSLNPGRASEWAQRAWGNSYREEVLPHVHRLGSIGEQKKEMNKFFQPFSNTFQERLRHASPEWLDEADRRITLRCLLSYSRQAGDARRRKQESRGNSTGGYSWTHRQASLREARWSE